MREYWALQILVDARDQAEADQILAGNRDQVDFLGGRTLPPGKGDGWRVQVFYADVPELTLDEIAAAGMRRVIIAPAWEQRLGITGEGEHGTAER